MMTSTLRLSALSSSLSFLAHMLLAFWFLGTSTFLWANSVETVLAVGESGGDCVWKVVTASSANETDLPPGVYTRGADRRWESSLVLGNVAGRRDASGLMQLSLTDFTKRLEAWAVVDSKLVFFHADSSTTDASSTVVVGSNSWPLLDPSFAQARQVSMPRIASLDDINAFAEAPNGNVRGQSILVSVRNPQSNFVGMDGLTFVVRLAGAEATAPTTLTLEHPVYVLDYQFHNRQELERLAVSKGYLSLSQLNNSLAPLASDPFVVKAWKAQLRTELKEYRHTRLPYLDPMLGQFVYPSQPQLQLELRNARYTPLQINASYPLPNHGPIVRIKTPYDSGKEVFGELDFKPGALQGDDDLSKVDLSTQLLMATSYDGSALFYLNRQLYLAQVNSQGRLRLLLIDEAPALDGLPQKLSFYVSSGVSSNIQYVLLSQATAKQAHTRLLAVDTSEGALRVVNQVNLGGDYYSASDLQVRLYKEHGTYYFDHMTRVPDSSASYHAQYDSSTPHLDLSASLTKGAVQIGFRKARASRTLMDQVAFQRFNSKNLPYNYDGIYRVQRDGQNQVLAYGELLSAFRDPEAADFDVTKLPTDKLELASGNALIQAGTIKLHAFAIDTTHQHGAKGFQLVLLAQAPVAGSAPDIHTQEIDFPFSELEKVVFHGGQRPTGPANFIGVLALRRGHALSTGDVNLVKLEFELAKKLTCQEGGVCTVFGSKVMKQSQRKEGVILSGEQLSARLVSGINTSSGSTVSNQQYYGELLLAPSLQSDEEGRDADPLASGILATSMVAAGGPQSTRVQAFVLDREFNGGASSFLLVLKATHTGTRQEQYYVKSFDLPRSTLTGIKLVGDGRADGRGKGRFGVIYTIRFQGKSYQSHNQDELPGYHSVFFNLTHSEEPARIEMFSLPRESLLEASATAHMDEVPAKLLSDAEGNLYWPLNDLALSHRMFQVRSLYATTSLYPNQVGLQLFSSSRASEVVVRRIDGAWRVHKPASGQNGRTQLPASFTRLAKEELEDYRSLIFGSLEKELEDMSAQEAPKAHKVLLVSKEVKRYVMNAIAARWMLADADNRKRWGHHNKQLALYVLNRDQSIDQDVLFKNFSGMTSAAERGEVPVLVSDLSDLSASLLLPTGQVDRPYTIAIPEEGAANRGDDASAILPHEAQVKKRDVTPSLLYLLAAEGRYLSLDEFPGREQPGVNMLLVGTPEEWQQIKSAVSLYEKSQQLLEDFEELSLETPTRQQRSQLLMKVLDDKAPLLNGITYDGTKIVSTGSQLSARALQEKVVDYAVSRSHALALEKGENVFVSFVKLLNKFKTTLKPALLKDGKGPLVMGKNFIENLASDLYGIPLNLNALPADDPLRVLSAKDAPMRLNDAGYSGNFDIKIRVIRGILGQINSGDQKTIPASFVLFGEKGTGKTFLFTTMVKMLGLRYYDFAGDDSMNEQAQVFKINLGNIIAPSHLGQNPNGPAGSTENMTVQQLLEHFDRFLKLPLGKRGFILFDDAHLSSDEVRGQVFAKLRSLFEAKDGRYLGVNIRNLVLFMTFNPTKDLDKIRKVISSGTPTPLQLALATFMGNDNKVDESFFNRWGDIINLDVFSTSAKGNELAHKLSESAKSHFNVNNSYFSVAEDTINRIVERFPKLNARDFLSSTVKSLAQVVSSRHDDEALYVIVPKHRNSYPQRAGSEADDTNNLVESFVGEQFYAVPFNRDARGYVHFLDLMVNSFRLNLYGSLIDTINSHPAIAGQEGLQKLMYQPIMQALKAHLLAHPKMPLGEFSFDLYRIKKALPLVGLDNFDDYADELSGGKRTPYFPAAFGRASAGSNYADYLLGQADHLAAHPSRLNLVASAWHGLAIDLKAYQEALMQNDGNEWKAAKLAQWAEALKPVNPKQLTAAAAQVTERLLDFTDAYISDLSLVENIEQEQYANASVYDATRVFLWTVDKAMAQLPWDKVSIFVVSALQVFAQDMSLAQYPGVQHWLFEEPRTLIRPVSRGNIFEKIKSSLLPIGEWSASKEASMGAAFDAKIDRLFYDHEAKS